VRSRLISGVPLRGQPRPEAGRKHEASHNEEQASLELRTNSQYKVSTSNSKLRSRAMIVVSLPARRRRYSRRERLRVLREPCLPPDGNATRGQRNRESA
jgi:hypothetical protein